MTAIMNAIEDPKVSDLLTLIGDAVEKLQRSVTLFESSDRRAGVDELRDVIARIDRYVQEMDGDPLLKLASIDQAVVAQKLAGVKHELSLVINALTTTAT